MTSPVPAVQRDRLPNVLNSHAVAGIRGRSQDHAVLLNIHDLSSRRTNSLPVLDSLSIGEGDSSKVGERNESAVLLKVLDDPLGVGLAQSACSATREGVRHRLAGSEVVDRGGAGGGRCGVHGYFDHVSGGDGDALEIVGILRVPLVPGGERGHAILDAEVDTCASC